MINTRSRTVPYPMTARISAPTALRSSHLGPGTCSGTLFTPAAGLRELKPAPAAQEKNLASATRARFTVAALCPRPCSHRLCSATSSGVTAAGSKGPELCSYHSANRRTCPTHFREFIQNTVDVLSDSYRHELHLLPERIAPETTGWKYDAPNDAAANVGRADTAANTAHLRSDEFVDRMMLLGCSVGFFTEYVPCDENPREDWMLDEARRQAFRQPVLKLRRREPIVLVQLLPDEYGRETAARRRGVLPCTSTPRAAWSPAPSCPFPAITSAKWASWARAARRFCGPSAKTRLAQATPLRPLRAPPRSRGSGRRPSHPHGGERIGASADTAPGAFAEW